MKHTFRIGETVVCINSKKRWYRLGELKENEMYTVMGFNPYDGGLILREVKSRRSGYHAYSADRFRKIDYAFAERLMAEFRPKRPARPQIQKIVRKYDLSILN